MPISAPPQNTKEKKDVTPFTIWAGGGEALGFCAADCCSTWLKICDISVERRNARTRRYTIVRAFNAVTVFCIGLVHGVGARTILPGSWEA